MKCVELFAGAGGLAMGVHLAGFKPKVVVEWNRWACDTIRENIALGYPLVADWDIHEGDVRAFDWESVDEEIDLVAGGPPCQPFSQGGKHRAYDDERDMFPATVDIIRRLQPKAFLIENVKGLTRSTLANYYQYILLRLTFPEIGIRKSEGWFEHFLRLQVEKTARTSLGRGLTYNVVSTLVNAADYGIPQKRERVFIVGFRADLGVEWSFPEATHSLEALHYSQWVTEAYWERHGIAKQSRPLAPSQCGLSTKLRQLGCSSPNIRAWRTVRDALIGLPDPEFDEIRGFHNHGYQAGARSYPGHTGSTLDLPAKTLKAGDHGVPGGENMLVRDDGSVRYLTVREAARLQTFPDSYRFHGSWTETMRQLGNAVPVMLGRIVAASVAESLIHAQAKEFSRAIGEVRKMP
jgi:DNA (cytosine-5)-methyltransferase 1